MCAICGIVNFHSGNLVDRQVIAKMTDAMAHRGPDDEGIFVEGRAGLGHRRLSIIDVSGGRQPIYNEDESAVIVFNGEVYNYRDLAADLVSAGHIFRTKSDTETILHAYEQYGEHCMDHLRGMFAFAIWDRAKQSLLLARDRMGIKPIYYYRNGRFLAFASEIKALLEIPAVPREVDPESLDLYLSLRYVPGPRTMFKNIFRLQPGHLLVAGADGTRIHKYWDINYANQEPHSQEHILKRFEELLDESVRMRLIAEVPLGVFLSGGLDSSAILATMRKSASGVKTFSVGYETSQPKEEEANEFEYARLAAGAFAAQHHEVRLNAGDFERLVPDLVWHLDEPLADPSCIPLYLISKAAREHITVVLSGEGADEILAGYRIYPKMLMLDRIHRQFPAAVRLGPWLSRLAPSEAWRHYLRMAGQPVESSYRGVSRGFRADVRQQLTGEDRVKRSESLLDEIFGGYFEAANHASPLDRMLYADAKVWLPDDLLIKADKMTMAHGLELRVPFLDHKMVEFAATLPVESKLNGSGKVLLRKAMRGVLPAPIIDRPKKGFPIPIASWLRGPMRDFTRGHLLARDSASRQYLDKGVIGRIVDEHELGREDRSAEIWTMLMFECWHEQFIDQGTRAIAPALAASYGGIT